MTPGDASPELDALVERTRGPQVWRRLFHAANGLLIASVLTWAPIPESWVVRILIGGAAAALLLDVVRLKVRPLNVLFFRAFTALVSPREARGISSSTWYMAGIAAAVALFPRHDAVSGILVMALADPAANLVGRRWGRHRFLGGSIEGTAAFLLMALVVLVARHPVQPAIAAALVAALAERRSWPLDDNFAVPVASAAVLALFSGWP